MTAAWHEALAVPAQGTSRDPGPLGLGAVAGALGFRATFLGAGAFAAAGLLLLHAGRRQLTTAPLPS